MNRMLSTEGSSKSARGTFSGSGTDTVSNASTWSQMIKEVEASKKNLPWAQGDFVPTVRVPLPERKRLERALDPVAMKLRDPKREADYSRKKLDRTVVKVLDRYNHIRDNEYNLVSHIGPPRNYDKVVEQVQANAGKPDRNWNSISHLSHAKQTTCPIIFNEEYMTKHVCPTNGITPPTVEREFNIISNQFSSNHDEKLRSEYTKMKKDMVSKYWETHDYNPLTCEYYADDKEAKTAAKDVAARMTHGANRDEKLPHCYKYCEGKAYDILTLAAKDEDMIKMALRKEVKKDNRLSKFKGVSEKQVQAGVLAYEKKAAQSMARVGYERWEKEIKRGYDFVNTGPVNTVIHKPLPLPRRSEWDKVHDEAFASNYNGNKSDSLATSHGAVPRETYARVASQGATNGQRSPTTHTVDGSARNSARVGAGAGVSPRSNAVLNAQGGLGSARMSARFGPDTARDSTREAGAQGSARGGGYGGSGSSARSEVKKVPALDLTQTGSTSVRTGGGL